MTSRLLRSFVALIVLALVTAGCGGGSSGSEGGVSVADQAELGRINNYVTDYNNASIPWSMAYKRGNRAAFLRVQSGYTDKMNEAAKRIQLAIADIRDPVLNRLMFQLGKAYAEETAAIVEADNAVVNRDQRADQRAIQHLQTAAQHKIDAINQLGRAFPYFFKP